jgi:hypothetical protein
MATPHEPHDPSAIAGALLEHLRVALTYLRALSAQPSADPFYLHAADQVAAILAGLPRRETSKASPSLASPSGGNAEPVGPDVAPPAPKQPELSNPG